MTRSVPALLLLTALLTSCGTSNEKQEVGADSAAAATILPDTAADRNTAGDSVAVNDTLRELRSLDSAILAGGQENNPDPNDPLIGKHVFGVQFIWDQRGSANITQNWNEVYIIGTQFSKDKSEYCKIEGSVTIISDKKFTVDGTIELFTKDCCGEIKKEGRFTFLKTGKRKFWRLQDFDQLCSSGTCAYYMDVFE